MSDRKAHPLEDRVENLGGGRRGFSLIEMLVVMGIVTVLMAILLPTLSRTRDSGRAVVCANNMRQLGIGFALAIDESPGHRYPPRQMNASFFNQGLADAGFPGSWINTTGDYFEMSVEAFAVCPSDESPFWRQPTPGFPDVFRRVSYGVNPYASLRGGIVNEPQHDFVTDMHAIARPSAFVGVGELPQFSPRFAIVDYIDTPQLVAAAITDDEPGEAGLDQAFTSFAGAQLHDNGAPNWLFLDGHVERLTREGVISLPGAVPGAVPGGSPLDGDYRDYDWSTNKLHPVIAR